MKRIRLLGTTLLASTTLLGAGQAFAATTGTTAAPASTTTEVQATLTLPNDGGENQDPPSSVDSQNPSDPGNKSNNPTQAFGIAYQPNVFKFGTQTLKDSGAQEFTATVPTSGDKAFHVGVKDKTRETKGWTLNASLTGDVANIPGVSMSLGNSTGTVKENTNTGLVEAPSGSVRGQSTIELSKDSGNVPVMIGQNDFLHNSIYDYQLGTPTLKIANAKVVAAKAYTGTVNWDLSVVAN